MMAGRSVRYVHVSRVAREQERRLAESLRGVVMPGSGNRPGARGDVHVGRWVIEAKWTQAKRFALRDTVLTKLASQAAAVGKFPAMVIEFRPSIMEVGRHVVLAALMPLERYWPTAPLVLRLPMLRESGVIVGNASLRLCLGQVSVPAIVRMERIARPCDREWLLMTFNDFSGQFAC